MYVYMQLHIMHTVHVRTLLYDDLARFMLCHEHGIKDVPTEPQVNRERRERERESMNDERETQCMLCTQCSGTWASVPHVQ